MKYLQLTGEKGQLPALLIDRNSNENNDGVITPDGKTLKIEDFKETSTFNVLLPWDEKELVTIYLNQKYVLIGHKFVSPSDKWAELSICKRS